MKIVLISIFAVAFLLILLGFGVLYFFYKMQDTRWWRLRQARERAREKEEAEIALKMKYMKDLPADQIEETVKRLDDNTPVEIPVQAFSYIHSHIDDYAVVNKDGQIVLIREEAYDNLLSSAKFKNIKRRSKTKERNNYVEAETQSDGSIMEFNHNEQSKKITNLAGGKDIIVKNGDIKLVKAKSSTVKAQVPKSEDSSSNEPQKSRESISHSAIEKQNEKIQALLLEQAANNHVEVEDSTSDAKEEETPKNREIEEVESNEQEEIEEVVNDEEVDSEEEIETKTPIIQNKIEISKFLDSEILVNPEQIKKLFLNLISQQEIKPYPVLFMVDEMVYLDSVYFAMIISFSLKKADEKNRFIKQIFLFENSFKIDEKKSGEIIKNMNKIMFDSNSGKIINAWGNSSSFEKKIVFNYEDNIYSSVAMRSRVNNLISIGIDVTKIKTVEFSDERPKINISKDLYSLI